MNLNIDNRIVATGLSRPAGTAMEDACPFKSGARASEFTITRAVVSPEDLAAAEIPDSALSRDDALGRLVGAAFNLPPPPMPDFAKL